MKLIASILSIYILLITGLKCVDVPANDDLTKIENSTSGSDDNHHDSDKCYPFCICDCCVTPVIQQNNSPCTDCQEIIIQEYPVYAVSYISSLIATIWQPPKIS